VIEVTGKVANNQMNDIPIFYFLCRYDEAIGNVYDDILRKKN